MRRTAATGDLHAAGILQTARHPRDRCGIRDLVAALRELPRGHPLEPLLRNAPDFRHEAALADALLHPQDRAYSVPQLFDFFERAGLRFGRWIKQAPYSPQCGVMAHLPQTSRLSALAAVDQYAAVEFFRGTMVRHSVVAYRRDSPAADGRVNFVDDACLDYVPIRVPDTICVRDRLPPGAAAVLINQTHTHTDLFLPIDARRKAPVRGDGWKPLVSARSWMTRCETIPRDSRRVVASSSGSGATIEIAGLGAGLAARQ